ncbi:bet1-like protein At4g14600 isoform X1 [Durio zibethinus]|uniref:Bet1-like protein At4g14600 isoform X1 n=1 Tax=Durio zibethinus TaxID=66656 RepID=A0A6P6B7G0_DURZI|nr:bet1-like protein At4g14600 isoform X1 [Durio zibethinus]
MASTSNRNGGDSFYGGAAHYRSREGLSTRPVASSDEIQLRIDPIHADLDDEITGLRSQVKLLRNVAQEIGSEAKFQKDFLDQLVFITAKCTLASHFFSLWFLACYVLATTFCWFHRRNHHRSLSYTFDGFIIKLQPGIVY